ncbi:MAG TPA: serine/threonine-protein kinase [Gemmatimonadales bacterium]|nr:serine/threonine-protein kinase [Gemmatimonadales bacterium]
MTGTEARWEGEFRRRVARALGDGYTVGERLGRGGFAVVYAATDDQLKRPVAVKVLREDVAEAAGVRERFRREAEAVARLRHPHVIPIYAVGEGEGLAYYIMPLVASGSLSTWLAREPRLPIAEAARVLAEAASALAMAHREGLVHRDIKPDNILLDGPERRVLLTDFGIAKAVGRESQALTQTGAVIGTPHYMSPEQASGEKAIDQRSDLYSLGVVGYQMLTGEVPFKAPTAAAVLLQHLTADPAPISRTRSDCPPSLTQAVMRCLAKAPEDRWASAEDLQRALGTADLGATVAVPRPRRSSGAAARAAAFAPVQRFRVVAIACAGGVVLCVATDLAIGRILLGPLSVIVAAFVVATEYGRLWIAGFTWRTLLSRGSAAPATVASPIPLDSAELGPHRATIAQARSDRGAMLAAIQGLPKSERQQLGEVLPTVDALIARVTEEARQLFALERQLEPGPEELARRLADTRNEAPSPGREQRAAMLERRLSAVQAIAERRGLLEGQLATRLATMSRLRSAVEQSAKLGLTGSVSILQQSLVEAQALIQDR